MLGNVLATFSRDNRVCLWDVVAPKHFPKEAWKLPRFLPMRELNGPQSSLCVGRIWPNKITFWQQKLVSLNRNGFNQTKFVSLDQIQGQNNTLPMQPRNTDRIWTCVPNHCSKMTIITDLRSDEKPTKEKRIVTITSTDDFHRQNHIKKQKFLSLSTQDLYETFGLVREQYNKQQLDLNLVTIFTKVFRDDFYVLLNRRRQLLISTDGCNFRIYGPFRNERKGHITAMTFYANVFVMGFDSGHFWVFFSKGPFDLMCTNLEENPHFEGSVQDTICDIDISPGTNVEIRVAVATSESVKLFVITPPEPYLSE